MPCTSVCLIHSPLCTTYAHCMTAPSISCPARTLCSVVLACPGQPGCLVAAANCATPGPLELNLHDIGCSAAGQAIAHGKSLQASLPAGSAAAAAAAAAWSDVAQMLGAGVPGITHLLCLPFGSRGSSHCCCGNVAIAGDGSCPEEEQLDSSAGSSAGALLCGFAAAPRLGSHHRAALAALLRHLPAATAQLSGGTLEFVSYVCGTSSGADCCCESDQGTEGPHSQGCKPSSPGPDGAGSSGAASAPHSAVPATVLDGSQAAVKASHRSLPAGGRRSDAPAHAAAEEASCASSAVAASPTASPARQHGFSKGLLAHVAAQPGALRHHSALCLHFSSAQVEQQYRAWVAPAQLWTDMLSSVLILAAMLIVALREVWQSWCRGACGTWWSVGAWPALCALDVDGCRRLLDLRVFPSTCPPQPFQLWYNSQATLALSLGMLAPLAFTTLSGPRYAGTVVCLPCVDACMHSCCQLLSTPHPAVANADCPPFLVVQHGGTRL